MFPGHVFKLRTNQIAAWGCLLLYIFCQISPELHELETEMWLHKITLKNAVSWVSDSVASQSPSSTLWRHNGWAGCGTTSPKKKRMPGKESGLVNSTVMWIKSQSRWICFKVYRRLLWYTWQFFLFLLLWNTHWSFSSVNLNKQIFFGFVSWLKSLRIQQTNQCLFNSLIQDTASFSLPPAKTETHTSFSSIPVQLIWNAIQYSR